MTPTPGEKKRGTAGSYALPAIFSAGLVARVSLAFLVSPGSDVYYYLKDGAEAVTRGMSPYGVAYAGIPPNLITPGVGHVFTYLPFTVLYLAPFAVGDVRAGMILADLAVAALLYAYGGRGRLASASAYLLLPPTVLFSTVYLNAALVAMVFLAGWLVLEARGRGVAGAASLGLALASSQFSYLVLPFSLAYCWRTRRWKEPLVALGVAALVMGPFFAAGPALFVSETLSFQFERGVTALYAVGGTTGFTFSPSLNSILMSAFGVAAPVYVKALIEAVLAIALIRVRDLASLIRNSFLFALASVFILPNAFFWAYLELPFMLLLFWLQTAAGRSRRTDRVPKT